MALPDVSIIYQNGGLGLVPRADDRVMGIVFNGNQFADPAVLFGMDDLRTYLQENASVYAYDQEIFRQVEDYYRVAGDGAELWFLTVDSTTTTAGLFALDGPIQTLINAASGRINVLAVSRYLETEPDEIDMLNGLEADMLNALDEAQALAEINATRHQPIRFILDGKNFSGDVATLRDLKTYSYNRVAVNVASNLAGRVNAAQGLLLGRIASIPVSRSIGRVKDGSVPTSEAFLTNGESVLDFGNKAIALNDKGFIFLRRFNNKAGYFWNDDHMATADTDDYFSLSNGRTIDKAARIAYATLLEELNDSVLVNRDTGKIVKTTIKQYQIGLERAIGLNMAVNEEISGVTAFVDPNQDILATSQLNVDLSITPTGTNRAIRVRLGLINPQAQA